MIPDIGHIVIYRFRDSEKHELHNYADECPAIVVRVWSPTMLNLKLITDGPFDHWKTSVQFGPDKGNWYFPEARV